GTGNDIMLIRFDNNLANGFESNIYNDSAGTWGGWVDIESGVEEDDHTTYEGTWGATVDRSTGEIYLTYPDKIYTLGTDDDVKTDFYNGSWTLKTNVVSASSDGTTSGLGITYAKIAIDENTGDIYVLYTGQTTPGDPPN